MKLAYYPGCSAKSLAREYDQSVRFVAGKLGLELVELSEANCCGTIELLRSDHELWLALNGRILTIASSKRLPLVTVCNGCLLNLRKAATELGRGGGAAERVRRLLKELGAEYSAPSEVTHLAYYIVKSVGLKRVSQAVVRRLEGLRVACFPGCQMLRPSRLLRIDDPEKPRLLNAIAEALGASPVEFGEAVKCCGGPVILEDKEAAHRRAREVLRSAREAGADCVVVACPLCHLTLEVSQLGMPSGGKMPILYFTQLMGLALGGGARELGLHRHLVPVEPLLRKIRAV